jgi:hypothetical protein
MPDLGKGIVWDSASNFSEVVDRVNKFNELMTKEPKTIAEMGERYKEMLFCPPSEQKVVEAFDLR